MNEKAPDEGRGLFLWKRMKKPLTKVGGFFYGKGAYDLEMEMTDKKG